MWILITGVNGFVGQQLAYFLLKNGKKVIGINRSQKNVGILKKFKENYIDFNDSLENLLFTDKKIYKVIHLASKTNSTIGSNSHLFENLEITKQVIDFCKEKSIKTLVFLSSISIYGEPKLKYIYEDTKIFNPTPYGMTKYFSELMLSDLRDTCNVVCIRVPAIIGKGASENLIVRWVDNASKNIDIELNNPHEYSNSLIHVDDVIGLIYKILFRHKIQGGLILNLASDKKEKIVDIATIISSHFNSRIKVSKMNSNKPPIISINKLKKQLNYHPLFVKDAILKFIIECY